MTKKIWKGKEFVCEICGIVFLSRHKNVKFCSNECRGKKHNNFLKDGEPWNKKEDKIRHCLVCDKKLHSQTKTGLCKEHYRTEEYKNNLSIKLKGKTGGYKKGSGRGRHGWYKGYWCDSSWELAWVIYHLDNNILFERNYEKFKYLYNGKIYNYIPDFKINDQFVEIKGYMTEQVKEKTKQFILPLKMYYKNEMKPILEYVKNKYGKDFIDLYDIKK